MCIPSFVVACCLSLTAVARNKGNSCEPPALLKEELRKTHILREDDEKFDREALARQAKAHWERNPSDPAAIYLHARSLVGRNTKEAIAKLHALATEAPDFPWTYLELSHIHLYPAFRDPAKSIENLKKWAAKCPSALEYIRWLENSGDADLMRDALRRLRKRLESSAQPEDSLYYGNAWSLEFRLAPVAEHAPVRQRVAEEVRQLREKNVMVLTFNFDTELGVVEPFMKEKQYDFPVVLARTFVERHQLFGGSRSWVIDRDGVLQYEWDGYQSPAEEWMKSVLETIQKVKEKQ
jgi:hypothetical protein